MATLFSKIKLYLEARGIDAIDEMGKYNLMVKNSGQVALGNRTSVIEKWDIDGVPQPTQEELDALESEADAAEALDKVHQNRKAEYPTIEELVVALYDTEDKAAVDEKRAAVKLKYPKS